MNSISPGRYMSTVKLFVALLSLFSTSAVVADNKTNGIDITPELSSKNSADVNQGVLKRWDEQNKQAQARENKRICAEAEQAVKKARTELSKKCSEAALKKECQNEAVNCTNAAGDDEYNSIGAFAEAAGYAQYSTALNTAFGGNKKSENGVCAKYSSKDYATERKEIQTDLEKVSDDLAKLIEDKAKMQKDFSKEMQDIQKKVNEAQEELEKQKLKIKDNKRERLTSFQNNQNQQKDQLRRINSSILSVKGEIITAERDKAMKLIALSDASGQRTCLSEYNKARTNSPKASSSSTSNFVASSSAKKKDLIAIYTDCIAVFQQQRIALNESSKQKMDQLNASLSDLQAQSEELTGTMDLASNQLAEMEKDAATEQSQAEQKVIKLMQTSQQEMLTAQQELTSNLQALSQKEATLKTKQNRLSNSLMSMGPTPKSGAKATPESIAGEAGAPAEDLSEAEEKLALLYSTKDSGCYDTKEARKLKESTEARRGNR